MGMGAAGELASLPPISSWARKALPEAGVYACTATVEARFSGCNQYRRAPTFEEHESSSHVEATSSTIKVICMEQLYSCILLNACVVNRNFTEIQGPGGAD